MGKFSLAVFNTQPPHMYYGGVERRIIETSKRLQNQVDITIYSGTKRGFNKSGVMDGVRFVPCTSTDRLFPIDNYFFNRTIARSNSLIDADVFEAHAVSGYQLIKKLLKQGSKKPFVHTIHGVLADEYQQAKNSGYLSFRSRVANQFMRRLAKYEEETAKNATLIVTISKYSLQKIQELYGIDEANVRLAPNGVDIEKFRPPTNNKSLEHQFASGDKPRVLFVGNLIPRKGLSFLVEAAKKVVVNYKEIKFLIAGVGPLQNQIKAYVENLNLSDNFMFIGKIEDKLLPSLYNSADVFVLPSVQEGQGIVLLEAQASARPVVAFDVGGINEAVVNKETGLLVKLGSSDELADAILKLLSDKTLRETMGNNGRKFIMENFTWDICSKKMLKIYHEALEN
jgi:glycosyltransferase involved in cell wall biosynthesis